jgi:hypothetical protein
MVAYNGNPQTDASARSGVAVMERPWPLAKASGLVFAWGSLTVNWSGAHAPVVSRQWLRLRQPFTRFGVAPCLPAGRQARPGLLGFLLAYATATRRFTPPCPHRAVVQNVADAGVEHKRHGSQIKLSRPIWDRAEPRTSPLPPLAPGFLNTPNRLYALRSP